MRITKNGEAFDLPVNFSIDIEDSNPVFNDRGSQSIPATVPATPHNERLTNFADRIDAGSDPRADTSHCEVTDGSYIRSGKINITSAGRDEGITFNVGFDNSTIYETWSKKKLSELGSLPVIDGNTMGGGSSMSHPVDSILDYLSAVFRAADPQTEPLAVFPIAVNNESLEQDKVKDYYWEVLNVPSERGTMLTVYPPDTVTRLVDGTVTRVNVPSGYGVSPFVRVWRMLELIFSDAGYNIPAEGNPFKSDVQLARLVVLNNVADCCCTGVLKYAELMPDVTVEQFLNSLWCRFGLVYNLNPDTGTVTLRLLRDIIRFGKCPVIDGRMASRPHVTFERPQFVKMTAQSSFDGAAPATERFEDFVKGYDLTHLRFGRDVASWKFREDANDWDYDIGWDDFSPEVMDPDDPDYPDYGDWDDDRDYYAAPRAARASDSEGSGQTKCLLSYEVRTCRWFKLDRQNGTVKDQSSSFFNWDPDAPDADAFELSSDDEWVPIERVNARSERVYYELTPLYLAGSRHYHSYIKGGDEDSQNNGVTTPLAFMFAFTGSDEFKEGTVGRFSPEAETGDYVQFPDGSKHTLSLLYQFKTGLFANFWKGFDEILRHGNRSVEMKARFSKPELLRLDMLNAVSVGNIPCLLDTVGYRLPATGELIADLKLRTLATSGSYDIESEQGIPAVEPAKMIYKWKYVSDNLAEILEQPATVQAAIDKYTQDHPEYQPTSRDHYIGEAVRTNTQLLLPTWQTDPQNNAEATPGAIAIRKYKANVTYDIFEVRVIIWPDHTDREIEEEPLGSVTITVEYTVRMAAGLMKK